MGFSPCKAEHDFWLRDTGDHCECAAVMVHDLLVFSKDPTLIIEPIKEVHGCELKGVGVPDHQSGVDTEFDNERHCWTMGAETHIKNVSDKIEKLLDVSLKNHGSPMETGDHPELDETDQLCGEDITICQTLKGCAQWAVTLGRFDVQFATNTLARFGQALREGHLKRALRMFGHMKHHARAKFHFDPGEPCYDGIDFEDNDWTDSHPDAHEGIVGDDVPEAKTPALKITVMKDASPATGLMTRRSVTGIMIFLGMTAITFCSKRQNTVESSSCSVELVAMQLAVEKLQGIRCKLRMMGIAIEKTSTLLGDNKQIVTNMQLPSSTPKKKHNSVTLTRRVKPLRQVLSELDTSVGM